MVVASVSDINPLSFGYLIIFVAVIFVANYVQMVSGFGGTVLAMPLCIWLLGMEEAKLILNIAAMLNCFGILFETRFAINWPALKRILLFLIPGLLIGAWLISVLAQSQSRIMILYAIFIFAVGLSGLLKMPVRKLNKNTRVIVLLASGIMHGAFLSGGPLLVLYVNDEFSDPAAIRATLALMWIVTNMILLLSSTWIGNGLQILDFRYLLLGLLPLAAAFMLGKKTVAKLSIERFRRLTNVLLLFSAALLFFA